MTVDEVQTQLKVLARQQKEAAKRAEQAGDTATAELCWQRSLTAKNGRFLLRDIELRDPVFTLDNQPLKNAAIKLGLTTTDPVIKTKGLGE